MNHYIYKGLQNYMSGWRSRKGKYKILHIIILLFFDNLSGLFSAGKDETGKSTRS